MVLALLKHAAQRAGHSYTLSHNAPLNSQYFLLLFRLLCHLEGSTSMQDVSLRQVFKNVACTLQVERLQRKFATIHSTLAQQQNNKPGPDTPRMSSLAHMHAENVSKVSHLCR